MKARGGLLIKPPHTYGKFYKIGVDNAASLWYKCIKLTHTLLKSVFCPFGGTFFRQLRLKEQNKRKEVVL